MLVDSYDLQSKDILLGEFVTDELVSDAEEYLAYVASPLGVRMEDMKATYYVKRFISCYVFREICVQQSYAGGSTWDMSESGKAKDGYADKYKIYDAGLKELEAAITVEKLTGEEKESVGFMAVPLYRG